MKKCKKTKTKTKTKKNTDKKQNRDTTRYRWNVIISMSEGYRRYMGKYFDILTLYKI